MPSEAPSRRPETGPQVIALAKIRNTKGTPTRDVIDEFVDRFSIEDPPLLRVYWDPHDWEEGFVDWAGNAGMIIALRELGYQYLTCDVQVAPGSGLAGDVKKPYVEVLTPKEKAEE